MRSFRDLDAWGLCRFHPFLRQVSNEDKGVTVRWDSKQEWAGEKVESAIEAN